MMSVCLLLASENLQMSSVAGRRRGWSLIAVSPNEALRSQLSPCPLRTSSFQPTPIHRLRVVIGHRGVRLTLQSAKATIPQGTMTKQVADADYQAAPEEANQHNMYKYDNSCGSCNAQSRIRMLLWANALAQHVLTSVLRSCSAIHSICG
jgi:hypothetical protein